jgi:SAM-dependent methyltransferase
MSKRHQTESQLLSVYQKVNPSTYRIETDDSEFQAREAFFSGLLHKRLCFPKKMFRDADLIEFGSGTGEHSLFYLLWGATGTFVEINDQAIARMESLLEYFKVPVEQYQTINQSIFDFEVDRTWDIAAAIGVLHHLEHKDIAFARMASCIGPGGYLILGIGNDSGGFQRNLQRLMINKLAGDNPEKIEEVAELLFTEHLDRAERFGHRSRKAIIYDTWVNPKIDAMSVAHVLNLFKTNGLEFYSSWPPIQPNVLGDSPNQQPTELLDHVRTASLPELVWMAHRDSDSATLDQIEELVCPMVQNVGDLAAALNDVTAERQLEAARILELSRQARESLGQAANPWQISIAQLETLLEEVGQLMSHLASKDLQQIESYLKDTQVLFRGTAGLGMTYYVAHRPEDGGRVG